MHSEKNTSDTLSFPLLARVGRGLWSFLKPVFRFIGSIIGAGLKTVLTLVLIFIFISTLGNVFSENTARIGKETVISGEGPNKILDIPLEGMILMNSQPTFGASGGTITPEGVRRALALAKSDASVKGIILEIDSPGGSAVASDRIYDEIKKFRLQTGKPVITLMGDTAASGGYYISTATNQIIANQGTITGSIGVIASTYNFQDLMQKIGIKEVVFKTGKYKDMLSFSRPVESEEKAIIDSLLNDTYQQFIDKVVEGRKMNRADVLRLADGRVYSGKQAKDNGLIDDIGNQDTAVIIMKELTGQQKLQLVRMESGSFFEQLFSGTVLPWFAKLFTSSQTPMLWYLMQ